MIDCNNNQNEYYLTDIVKMTRPIINIHTFLIDSSKNYEILGVNTPNELDNLEKIFITLSKKLSK